VQLQIEEDLHLPSDDFAHKRRPVRDERLQSDLQQACDAAQLVGQCENLVARGEVGGDDEPVQRLEPIFKALAPEEGYAHVGPSGAGHFVKMVHNGIEYGLMQSYAEGFEIMEHAEYDLDAYEISGIWRNGSVVRSWLLELLHAAFETHGSKLEDIAPYVEDSGEGRWTINEAINENVPVPVIAASLFARFQSRDEIKFSARVAAALRNQFGGHAIKAVERAKAGQDPR
jgi:6-phosphogluconate dehydrogenase